MTHGLIGDEDVQVEFAIGDLIKGDIQSAARVAVSAVNAGILTTNEARDMLGFAATDLLPQVPIPKTVSGKDEDETLEGEEPKLPRKND